jgi:hypothetical protein
MKWPLADRPIPDRELPLYNRFYLHASAASRSDPALVWGTEIEAEALQSFLRERNRDGRVVITAIHLLIRATALALAQYPDMNVRIVGRRIYSFRDINIRMAFFHRRNLDIDLLKISQADAKSLEQIAAEVWHALLQAGRNERGRDRDLARFRRLPGFFFRQIFRFYSYLDRHWRLPRLGRLAATREGCATVNDLSFPGAPPMRSYKPTRFPDMSDSLNLTIGPIESKVVERDGRFVSVTTMPLVMRADHRIVDAYVGGRFLAVVRDLLNEPQRLDAPADATAAH